MAQAVKIPDCGDVTIMVGLMGAGKSYAALKHTLEVIQAEARPVFTNLPLRVKVVRQYLRVRCGPEFARLIYPLTQAHFRRYVDRQHHIATEREKAQLVWVEAGRRFPRDKWERRYFRKNGPHITSGPNANWIHDGAILVLDELHHWYPQAEQKNDRTINDYLTMLRHHVHSITCITQDEMNLNNSIRKLCGKVIEVRARHNDVLAWGIRFRHLGLKAISYVTWSRDQWDNKKTKGGDRRAASCSRDHRPQLPLESLAVPFVQLVLARWRCSADSPHA